MGQVAILGVFVADMTFRAARQPRMGETLVGSGFALGPGGKGSNQAVAAARAAATAHFITKLGDDDFARLAHDVWARAGVTPHVRVAPESYTGGAGIFIDEATGDNAIIISPGAAATIAPEDLDAAREVIAASDVFMTQLEQPMEAALRGLEIARTAGVTTILNPAPAASLAEGLLALSDFVTPNETETEMLTGVAVTSVDTARAGAEALRTQGARSAIITLGENGALYVGEEVVHVPAITAGPVVETTGAGDALNGGFAAALADGADPVAALRFGTATAALSVTRAGAAAAMPERAEIDALLAETYGAAL